MSDYSKLCYEAKLAARTEVGAIRHDMNKWRRLSSSKYRYNVIICGEVRALCIRHKVKGEHCMKNGNCCLIDGEFTGCEPCSSLYGKAWLLLDNIKLELFRDAAYALYLRLRRELSKVESG